MTNIQVNMLEMVLKNAGINDPVAWHNNLSFLEKTVESNPAFIPTTTNYRVSAACPNFPMMG